MIVIQGIPYDEKSSYLEGAAMAPSLIRDFYHSESSNYFAENGVDTESSEVTDVGDFEIDEYFQIEQITRKSLEKGHVITLGGDHSITYPIVRAHKDSYEMIDILHFDAHPDLYDSLDGDQHSHACPFARIMENGLAERLVQVGIRTLNEHQREQADEFGVEVIEMKDFQDFSPPVFENPVYLSIDIDAFDPAFAPGVSHQEPGGLTSREVIDLIANFEGRLIGADIVEYNPTRDTNEITGALAAKLLKELLGRMLR